MATRISRRGPLTYSLSLTHVLIALNIVAFFIFLVARYFFPFIDSYLVLTPSLLASRPWILLTSMFLHAGFLHLFVNMLSLFFLGGLVERIIGRKRFFWVYIISGFVAGLFFVTFAYLSPFVFNGDLLFGTVDTAAVGASGALFGLLGVLAVILPSKRVYLVAGPLILIILQFIVMGFVPSSLQGGVSFAFTILMLISLLGTFSTRPSLRVLSLPLRLPFWLAPIIAIVPLFIIGFFVSLPIGNTAHLGGLIAGLVYGFYLRTKYSRKIEMLNRSFR